MQLQLDQKVFPVLKIIKVLKYYAQVIPGSYWKQLFFSFSFFKWRDTLQQSIKKHFFFLKVKTLFLKERRHFSMLLLNSKIYFLFLVPSLWMTLLKIIWNHARTVSRQTFMRYQKKQTYLLIYTNVLIPSKCHADDATCHPFYIFKTS